MNLKNTKFVKEQEPFIDFCDFRLHSHWLSSWRRADRILRIIFCELFNENHFHFLDII